MNLLPHKNYYKKILRVALPAIAGLSSQMVVSLVDTAMVGRLDEATYALAAMGIGVLATWALISFFSSLATGIHVIVARKYGQADYISCGLTLNNAIFIALLIGTIVAAVGIFFANPIAHLFAADPVVGDYASDYIFYRFLGIPFFLISVSYRGFFFGISKTKIFMISGVVTNLLNIIFNYILIYGEFGFPRMGLAGAGLGSTTISRHRYILQITLDNSYIYLLWKMGIVGLVSFLSIYYIVIRRCRLILKSSAVVRERIFAATMLINTIGLLIVGMTNVCIAHYRFIFVWLAAIAGIEAIARKYD